MQNEIILIVSLIVLYSMVVVAYKMFGTTGLYVWTAIATITANIEVLILVDAFGMEQTLGNILFASTFLVTDILSEMEGKKAANKAVQIGIATSIAFIFISQSWLLYTPNQNDWAMPSIQSVFTNTPRMMIAGIAVYAFVQVFDVWAYHKIWDITAKASKDSKKFLWIRNNGSTLLSQLMNTILFTLAAFIGVYDVNTLIHIMIASYIIFIVTSLFDTPAVYITRKFCKTDKEKNIKKKI